ncbi:MAG: peroxidase family protein, partial [Pirellulales bacterium]
RAACFFLLIVGALVLSLPRRAVAEDRSYDGSGNNLTQPSMGAINTRLSRDASGAHYADGISAVTGIGRPSARLISNTIVESEGQTIPDPRGLTGMIYTWGQFMAHDLDLRVNAGPAEPFNIPVPIGDPDMDPLSRGDKIISMRRTSWDAASGTATDNPREQLNKVTGWVDASMVYGSDSARAAWLRAGTGGRLKSFDGGAVLGELLPKNDGTQFVDGIFGPSNSTNLFVAGDGRVNEQPGLNSIHTVFSRDHNYHAGQLAVAHPEWTDEQIYQRARKIVGAQVQAITYNEFVPQLLGPGAIPAYTGYNPSVDASIRQAFATSGFRVGHSMVNEFLLRLGPDWQAIPAGPVQLRDAFFAPQLVTTESYGGVDPILRGLLVEIQQKCDIKVTEEVRSYLFGQPGAGGLDLAALNIQRGRDHGLPDYNTMRTDYGLPAVTSFSEITSDATLRTQLAALYGTVDNIDPWVGGLSENYAPGSSVGPLFSAIIADQFRRSRDGDRFWYQNDPDFTPEEVAELSRTTLADLIMRNTTITGLPRNVFRTHSDTPGDIDLDGDVDRTDAAHFAQFFGKDSGSNWRLGDFDGDGRTGLADWALLQSHLNADAAPAAAVPEPSALLLVLAGAFGAAFFMNRTMRTRVS